MVVCQMASSGVGQHVPGAFGRAPLLCIASLAYRMSTQDLRTVHEARGWLRATAAARAARAGPRQASQLESSRKANDCRCAVGHASHHIICILGT